MKIIYSSLDLHHLILNTVDLNDIYNTNLCLDCTINCDNIEWLVSTLTSWCNITWSVLPVIWLSSKALEKRKYIVLWIKFISHHHSVWYMSVQWIIILYPNSDGFMYLSNASLMSDSDSLEHHKYQVMSFQCFLSLTQIESYHINLGI